MITIIVLLAGVPASGWLAGVTVTVSDYNQLLFDDKIIDSTYNVQRTANPPELMQSVLEPVFPWESFCLSYFNVMEDAGVYRMWYGAYEAPSMARRICYATSIDGLTWTRPDLGLVTFEGSTSNNILPVEFDDGGSIFIDPLAPADSRYKLLGNRLFQYIYESSDGINFQLVDIALLDMMADSHNLIFYDDRTGTYVAYLRSWNFLPDYDGGTVPNRTVSRLEVNDPTEPWPYNPIDSPFYRFGPERPPAISTELEMVLAADSLDPPNIDIYNPSVNKYSEAPDVYLAFPSIFEHYPPPPEGQFYSDGVLNVQLAVSRDGIAFERFRTPYIDFACFGDSVQQMYMGLGMLRIDDFYYQYLLGYRQTHGNPEQFGRYYCFRQRVDGFVSLDAKAEPGELLTKILLFEGNSLRLNYTTSGDGFLVVGMLSANGDPVVGYSLKNADTLRGDNLAAIVSWQGRQYVGHLQKQGIRLHLKMRNAKLYSLRFDQNPAFDADLLDYVLHQNYPNPFNSGTSISFDLLKSGFAHLDIYNVLGQRVTTLIDGHLDVGVHSAEWNGRDDSGRAASTGIYFYRLSTAGRTEVKKMLLLR